MRHLSTLTAAAALLGICNIPAGAKPAALGNLHGKWALSIKGIEHASDGSKPGKSSFVAVAQITDCSDTPTSAICVEFKDASGNAVSLVGSRFGNGFFVKSSDGNLVLSGTAVAPAKSGLSSKFRGVGSRIGEETIDSLIVSGKRLSD